MTLIPKYNEESFEDLRARSQYESWLLEAVYNITELPFIDDWPDQIIYPANGAIPMLLNYGRGHAIIGDWRPKFLVVGAPLLLVTSFKLLDMLIEWILEQNEISSTFRFSEKIKKLKGGVIFPFFIESRAWLRDRIIGLYEHIEPLRSTIIHARHFKTSEGTLYVSNSKSGSVGPEITIKAGDLRSFTVLVISLFRYIDGGWTIDLLKEKHLRRTLDEIAHLHCQKSLGQKTPRFLTVRAYIKQSDAIDIDLRMIRNDVSKLCQDQDVIFDLRVITVNKDCNKLTGYLFPWPEINEINTFLIKADNDIASYQCPLPDDINTEVVLKEFSMV